MNARRSAPILVHMILQLLLPVLGLMLVTVLVTRGVEAILPESLGALAATTVISALLVWLLTSAGFALLYTIEDARVWDLLGQAPSASLGYFLRLGASAVLIWGPVLLLVVSTAPRRWKTAVW
ncbi:hypothetical protein CDZ97_16930 [Mameliella alba]|nr:hypothetical protein CDZ95_17430 [Mameliella alba]OWV47946.1 hypothetical protein CDZ96_12715 [Mameliella alba]OWV60830.1 hypothetical protein CDZ98_07200 [Mameliella alba]OWV61503.1 hypothetical protein CDZ97_16930 [Mameliella alba]GGF62659.1 hypothetical protein GCM10011319_24620 [Mameliella alba]